MQTLPIHLDLFALIILLGIAQGVFLGVFFLTGERGQTLANRCFGWFMLSLSAVITEMFLCYTNYMFRVLWLIDFSEPFNFILGPLFFFFVYARIHQRLPRGWAWHLIPFGIWVINSVTWFYQPVEFKYNAYLHAYHPELAYIRSDDYILHDFTNLRAHVTALTLFSCFVYALWACLIIWQAYRRSGERFLGRSTTWLSQLRNLALLNVSFPVLAIVVKPNYQEDLGDYWLACYITGIIYVTSYFIMRGSDFLQDERQPALLELGNEPTAEPKKKYEKSALSEEVEEAILQKLTRLMANEKPYLQPDVSLPKLAGRLQTSPHHLSQLLNDRLGQNFFDWLATHRIAEAQRLLNDAATAHLKIDEIAERVGYNSTSAFHTSFKRITGQTPAQYRAIERGFL